MMRLFGKSSFIIIVAASAANVFTYLVQATFAGFVNDVWKYVRFGTLISDVVVLMISSAMLAHITRRKP
jgi:hypothetical protein